MIGQAIKWLLIGYGADGYNPQYNIYDVIGDNVFPDVVPQDAKYLTNQETNSTLVVYRINKNDPDKIKQLRAPNNKISFDLDVIDKKYSKVNLVSTLIINQLNRYKNSYNSNDSDSIGYGTTEGANKYGRLAPASTGGIQYVGGLQINFLEFKNSIESFDEDLELYRNTLSFDMYFIDDLSNWGADVVLKFTDLNLMATNINSNDDPLYTQPISIGQGVNYLFSPSVLNVDNSNISNTTLDGIYEHFYDTTGTSNTNRPSLLQSALNPPKYNKQNNLFFDTSKFLQTNDATNRLNRKYKEVTFFCVASLPGSTNTAKCSAVISGQSSTTSPFCSIMFSTQITLPGTIYQATKFIMTGTALEDNGSGGEIHRGFQFQSTWTSWPFFEIMPDVNMEDPFYFAVNFKRNPNDNTYLSGEFEWISSSDFTAFGDNNDYHEWDDTASSTFKEYFFNFETIHTDLTNYDTRGAGTLNINDQMYLWDFVLWPETITFGSNKYMSIKRQIIEKHNMWKRTEN